MITKIALFSMTYDRHDCLTTNIYQGSIYGVVGIAPKGAAEEEGGQEAAHYIHTLHTPRFHGYTLETEALIRL